MFMSFSKACLPLAALGLSLSLAAAPALAAPHMGGGNGGFHGGNGGFHGGNGGFRQGGMSNGINASPMHAENPGVGFQGGQRRFNGGVGNGFRGHDNDGGRGFRRGYGYNNGYYGNGYYGNGYGAALGLGVVGGLAGAAIIGSQYPYYDSGYGAGYYDTPAPQVGYEVAPVETGGDSEAYCERTFKSYDPATGTYLGYDGVRHSCP